MEQILPTRANIYEAADTKGVVPPLSANLRNFLSIGYFDMWLHESLQQRYDGITTYFSNRIK